MHNAGALRMLRLLPFVAVAGIILFTGLKPEPVPQMFDQQDKLHHLLGFTAFAFALRLAFPRLQTGWALALSLGVAMGIELAQGLQPYRHASVGDMAANTLGVLLGWSCWAGLRRHCPSILGLADTAQRS